MVNAYTLRLFLVQMLNKAYLLACFAGEPCAAGESVVLPSLEMPRSVISPATDQAISQFPDSAPFNSRHDNETSVIEPPYQLFAHRPPARGTQLILMSPTTPKKSCIDRARTSGLGSNASMANAYTPRLFLVQLVLTPLTAVVGQRRVLRKRVAEEEPDRRLRFPDEQYV
ncbi:hypothetical protein HPB51_022459 [Rhipicephalus microplus]|uniref:Uncharacterized protein n=1 Tax=Rhipicephalus microplus TaxID=6941 RepID=A0A9J6DQN0_RHIMP|nr:hypothetical protein HPB51_022459 [Rhipicephalus microplus]